VEPFGAGELGVDEPDEEPPDDELDDPESDDPLVELEDDEPVLLEDEPLDAVSVAVDPERLSVR
jgi:hypothetical protein